jgi:hypothetical protein
MAILPTLDVLPVRQPKPAAGIAQIPMFDPLHNIAA